jgi:trk system potassium uptake protein
VLAVLTQSDEENLAISLLAKRRFQIPRIVARVNDPANEALFDSSWGGTRSSRPPPH